MSDLIEVPQEPVRREEGLQQRGQELKILSLFKSICKFRLTFESTELETIYMYDSIMKRKGMLYGGFLWKLTLEVYYPFTASHEYDTLRNGIMKSSLLVRLLALLLFPATLYIMYYWRQK